MLRFKSTFMVSTRMVSAVLTGTVVLLVASVVPVAQADDAPPSGYPSWADVEAAKNNVSAKSAEVDRINALLDGLQAQAGALGEAAVKAGSVYAVAQSALDASNAKLGALKAQTDKANAKVAELKKQAGALAAQNYKTGGANLGMLVALDTVQSADGLQKLDVLRIVTQKTTDLYNRSTAAEGVARALTDQQAVVQSENERLADDARSKLAAAQSAQKAAEDKVAEENQHSQTLVAQLASLKDTSASVEQGYRDGVAAQAAYEAQQEAKRRAAEAAAAAAAQAAAQAAADQAAAQAAAQAGASNGPAPVAAPPASTSSGFIPVNVLLPNIPGGAVNDPSGAQSYASGRLGAFGWGSDQFSCLTKLWNQESSWMTNATNPSSGAYGVAQALPPSKYSSTGSDWLTSYRTQIDWGLGYIKGRYGSPCGAWAHEVSENWY